jgi:hypothetical protein
MDEMKRHSGRPTFQRDLFGRQAAKATSVARRSMPKIPLAVEPFDFDGDLFAGGIECVPRPGFVIPQHLRLPTDDPDWMPDWAKRD